MIGLTQNKTFNKVSKEFRYISFSIFLLILFVILLLIFSIVIKVDTYVYGSGYVQTKIKKAKIAYNNWGYIDKLFVKEGSFVKKGQILAKIKNIKVDANFKGLKKQYFLLLARKYRLEQEVLLKKLDKEKFNQFLIKAGITEENLKNKLVNLEYNFFKKDMNLYKKKIYLIELKLQEINNNIFNTKNQLKQLLNVKQFLEDILLEEKKLLKNKLVNKELYYKYKLQYFNVINSINEVKNQLQTFLIRKKQLKVQKKETFLNFQTEILRKMEELQQKLIDIKANLNFYKNEIKFSYLKAPITGTVLNLQVHHINDLVKPGEILLEIIPSYPNYEFTAFIKPQDRVKVKVGQKALIHIAGLTGVKSLNIEAKVKFISDGLIKINNKYYYKAILELTSKGASQLKKYKIKLINDLPISTFIITNKISPIEYILQPVIQYIKKAFVSP